MWTKFQDSKPTGPQSSLDGLNAGFRASLNRYFSRRVKDRAEIEDLTQEVFVRLVKRGGLEDIDKLGGYVFETASHVLIDRARRERSRGEHQHDALDPDHPCDVDFSPERVLIGRERLSLATAALLELPERTRVIFVLRRLEGMRYLDISKRLGISVSAVEKHMARAMIHLMSRMDAE